MASDRNYGNVGFPVLFDVETLPHERAAEFIPLPLLDPTTYHVPKSHKKPETIQQWKVDETARRQDAYTEELEKSSLDPDLCRIVALGYETIECKPIVLTCTNEHEELAALEQFWDAARHSQFIGFNCIAFDMPVLLRRSLMLGAKAPGIQIAKYRHPAVTDVYDILNYGGLLKWRPQSFYLKRFGLPMHDDPYTGADVARLVGAGEWDAVTQHCLADIAGLRELAIFLGLIRKETEVF